MENGIINKDENECKIKNTIIIKIDPATLKKKNSEVKINKIYVAPNKVSKQLILKKLNDPNAEIIDASSLYDSCDVSVRVKFEPKKKLKNENIDEARKTFNQETYIDNTIQITSNHKEDLEPEITEHEISEDIPHAINEMPKEEMDLCHIYNNDDDDDDINDSQPYLALETFSKQSNLNWMNSRGTKDMEERMELAIQTVLNSNMSVKRAAHVFGIRYSILVSKINKAGTPCKGVLGADPALTEKEELALVEWIKSRYKAGCPVKKIDLVNRVADLVSDGRSTRFKDGKPGEKWFMNFMSRNPSVSILGPATRCDSREAPSKQSITSWFSRCENHLQAFGQTQLLNMGERVGSIEELTLCLLSVKTKVSKSNGSRGGLLYLPQEKSGNIMVLIGACADGLLTPPMPVFSCRKPPPTLINSIPSGWGIGLSKDGNINKEVLHSYFKNILIPWLGEHARLPFILFIDKLKTFLSVDTADFCAQKGLLIYNFHPNSHKILQPLFKSVIEPIKKAWGALSIHRNEKEALLQFSPTLNQMLFDLAPPVVIVDSFKSCGIYPFDPKAPDYSKCLLFKDGKHNKIFSSNEYTVALEVFEDLIGKVKTEIFQESLHGFKLLKSEDSSLYKIWHKLVSRVDVSCASDTEEYRHEKIIRGANRKLPRPEMYLMVAEDEGSMQTLSSFNKAHTNVEIDADDPDTENELEIEMENEDRFERIGQSVDNESSSAIWKDKYRSRDTTAVIIEDKKIKKIRKLDRIGRKLKRDQSIEILSQDELATKKLKRAIGPRYCTQCLEENGKLIKCMVCRNHIHVDCMREEEQQILSELYEDRVAFDYICPGCS